MFRFFFFFSLFFISFLVDGQKSYVIDSISIIGNTKTKRFILERELEFSVNSKISVSKLQEFIEASKENLLRLSLFNFVDISYKIVNSNHVLLFVNVQERWYFWPYPILRFGGTNINSWLEEKNYYKLSYGVLLTQNNFRGRNEILSTQLQWGYTKQVSLQYDKPFIDGQLKHGVKTYVTYFSNNEVIANSVDNEQYYIKNDSSSVLENTGAEITYIFRPKINYKHLFSFGFYHVMVKDTVLTYNPNFLLSNKITYMTFDYRFDLDFRDQVAYPLSGIYAKTNLNVTPMLNESEIVANAFVRQSFKHYIKLDNKFYIAYSVKGKYSFYKNPTYYFQRGLGYDEFVRGYEYYLIDGLHYFLFRSNLKYNLLKPTVSNLSFVKNPKFSKIHYALYLNLFFDFGYVYNNFNSEVNNLTNDYLQGVGLGLDFVTYYDKIIRFETTLNHLDDVGFYIHFIQPI